MTREYYSVRIEEKSQAASIDNKSQGQDLEFIHDVALPCTVEFGRAEISIRKLLTLEPGAVLELSKEEGEAIDVRANGNLVARGEVIVVNDRYGVRITEIVDPD